MPHIVNMLPLKFKHASAKPALRSQTMETMGDRIKHLRIAKDWTQDGLAQRVSVTREAVSQWERGETKNIKNVTFLALVRELGTTPEYLVHGPADNIGRSRRPPQAKNSDSKA